MAAPTADPATGEGVSPERAVALRVLVRADAGAYADRALRGEASRARLGPRERSHAMRLAYGAVQRRRTLDWLIDGAADRPEALEPAVRNVLRLGAYELAFSDGTPPRAAVDQAVRAARGLGGGPRRAAARAGVVNAVLRRLADESAARLRALEAEGPVSAALLHSMPDWIADRLAASLGAEDAAIVMAAANRPAESALRWNPLRGPRATLERELPPGWRTDPLVAEAYVLEGPFALEASEAWARGRAMAQSRASMLPAHAVAPRPGERILDLCAAPGAKATHLAALTANGARITSVELRPARAQALRDAGPADGRARGGGRGRRPHGGARRPVRRRAGRPALHRPRRARRAPRRALAPPRGGGGAAGGAAARRAGPRARRRAPRRARGVLDLHAARRGERGGGAGLRRGARRPLGRRSPGRPTPGCPARSSRCPAGTAPTASSWPGCGPHPAPEARFRRVATVALTDSLVLPSVMSADFLRVGEQLDGLIGAGARVVHVDVMDGHFVPNLTLGPGFAEAVAGPVHDAGGLVDVHLMVARPGPVIPAFARAVDAISVHYEADPHPQRLLATIRELGCRAGLAVNRGTPPVLIEELIEDLDYVNCLAISPGLRRARRSSRPRSTSCGRCGGCCPTGSAWRSTAGSARRPCPARGTPGANLFVSATAIFGAPDPVAAYAGLAALAGA